MNDFLGFDEDPTPPTPTPPTRKGFVPVGQLRGDIPKDEPTPVEKPSLAAVVLHSEEEAEEPSLAVEETLPTGKDDVPPTTVKTNRKWLVPLVGVGLAAVLVSSGLLFYNPQPGPLVLTPPAPSAPEPPEPVITPVPEPEPEPEPVPETEPEPIVDVLVEPEQDMAPEVQYDNVQRVIGFKPDQAALTKKGRKALRNIAKSVPEGVSVDVYGYVWEGTPGSSFTLDTARAQTVAKFLRKQGVSVGTVEGKGKKQRGVVVAWMEPVTTS